MEEKNEPIDTIQIGTIKAAVWQKETESARWVSTSSEPPLLSRVKLMVRQPGWRRAKSRNEGENPICGGGTSLHFRVPSSSTYAPTRYLG